MIQGSILPAMLSNNQGGFSFFTTLYFSFSMQQATTRLKSDTGEFISNTPVRYPFRQFIRTKPKLSSSNLTGTSYKGPSTVNPEGLQYSGLDLGECLAAANK